MTLFFQYSTGHCNFQWGQGLVGGKYLFYKVDESFSW